MLAESSRPSDNRGVHTEDVRLADPEHSEHHRLDPDVTGWTMARTAQSRSWLWPALAVVVILAVAIGVGRLGQTPVPPQASQRAAAVTLLAPTRRPDSATASLTIRLRPVYAAGTKLIGPPMGVRTDTDRFDDGILAELDGEPVVRVRDAAALPMGSVALVGGWQSRSPCQSGVAAGPCVALLSDVPFRSARTAALVLGGQASFDITQGPRIFRATIEPDPNCTMSAFDNCLAQLVVGGALWQGDEQTTTGPIDSAQLLGGIASRFPTYNVQAFTEASSCPVSWPVQSYLLSDPNVPRVQWTSLEVRLVVLYPTTQDRVASEPALRRAAAALTPFDAYNRCVAIPGGVDDNAWVVRDNAMILLGSDDPGVRATIDAALSNAVVPG
jgi:hypothetical protein